MADVHTEAQRSYNMSKIRGTNTKPEVKLRKALFANGFRYSLHSKKLSGKPDIVLRKYNTVILVNGCFWHGHAGCQYFIIPKTRIEFWTGKIDGTIARDKINFEKLTGLGWKVITVWECELKTKKFEETLQRVINEIKSIE